MEKILTTPRSYGKNMPQLFEALEGAGYEVVRNTTGGILDREQMKAMIAGCVGVIVGVDPLDAEILACAPKLRAVSKYGVGVDNIDLEYCAAHDIKVSRTVGANSEAVADYAMALMLAVARRVPMIDRKCRRMDWGKITTRDVSHATLGLFGLGAIGRHVARRAQGFGMRVIAYDPYWPEDFARENDIARADADTIFREADFISLHLPLMPETEGFVGERELSLMKSTAILINTARGALVDEKALLTALKENRIYGAGLDAFAHEPPEDDDWFSLDNVVLGSHCAASTTGATENMGRMATDNLLRDLAGA